jgi:hypothetical protein
VTPLGALPVRLLEPSHRYWQAQIGPRQSAIGTFGQDDWFVAGNFQVSTDVNVTARVAALPLMGEPPTRRGMHYAKLSGA